MIRLFTLTTIFWFAVVSFISYFGDDEPIWPWMAICAILAVALIIQTIHFRFRGIYSIEPHKNPRGMGARLVILRTVLIPGGVVSFITMIMLLHQNNTRPSSAETLATTGATAIASLNAAKQIMGSAQTQILILILTSWTPKGYEKRQVVRETTIRLLPQNTAQVAFTYKFIIGEAPNARVRETMGSKIKAEQDRHDDLLILPVSDTYEDLSLKVFRGLEWANKFKFDFLCKTDDDIFVRWDVVARELMELGPTHYYWRGLAYWDILPITNPQNKNIEHQFKLGMFPPFVAGSLYIFSRDVVTLLTYPGPRLFTKNEDQNVGIWLHPYNIKPIHDKRIQQWDVCEDDMLAKHFSDAFTPLESMHDMYKNVIENRPLCQGFRQVYCAACYSCLGRSNHWRDWGVACDSVRGITNIEKNELYQGKASVDIKDSMPEISKKDEWILPGLLTDASSVYSDTDDWARLHWAIWTTDPATTWQPRHFQAIETLFVHNPNVVLIIMSNTLPSDFFVDYIRQGYKIHILSFSKELLLARKWFFSPNTEDWLQRWDEWVVAGKFFPVHLADYLRLVALYKYGGLYMDMDALWVRAPGDAMTEFIGADLSDYDGDRVWTLDDQNTYLANGVMRFQRGRSMFRHIADSYFTVTNYDPECFNCGGPKAFTMYVKTHRTTLESNGLKILPREALYPYNWKEIEPALRPSKNADEEIRRIEEHSIGLHLYGKVTSKKSIEEGSVVAAALKIWGLDLFAMSSSSMPTLQGPKTLYYPTTSSSSVLPVLHGSKGLLLERQPGAFRGIDAVFVRGALRPSSLSSSASSIVIVVKKAAVMISVQEGFVAMDTSAAGTRKIELDMGENVTMAQLNTMLSRIRYLPPITTASHGWDGSDQVTIQVSFGQMQQKLVIPVVRRVIKT
ncbi:Beta-1,3-galactosyltransferase 6 [Modicella reniformis]|uniref:Beta-1,3-galactosyltransferase 6 n=1 Tax=Modicella reniformis TaxID=1440133 RepID=A0A9P6MJD1_9FUNG|nr:Beta-1,3-galactosyltransferase 6 [Modicella reniformis]